MNFVPCLAWVSKGVAKTIPDKLQLSADELKRLVDEAKESIDADGESSENADDSENEEIEDEECDAPESDAVKRENTESVAAKRENTEDDDINEKDAEFNATYNMDNYDDDEEKPFMNITDVAVYVDNNEDKFITDHNAAKEDDEEEEEDFKIKCNDNLLVVGHVEENSSVLEIYVYNKEDNDFYVHHDIVLSSFPLALEWLDFHPSEDKPGNYIAIGDMSPVIKIFDLDVVDILEPDYCLGEELKKKKKKAQLQYHSDAVISLSWNKNIRNILASGSADTSIIIWNLEEGTVMNKLDFHTGKVQALLWHPFESSFLLSGCTDGLVGVYDCRSDDATGFKSWTVEGEVERVCWNLLDSLRFFCSNDSGIVYSIDMKQTKYEVAVTAHKQSVTALEICPDRPNILLTASMDRFVSLWDVEKLKKVTSFKMKVGSIYAVKFAPDCGLTAAFGGNNASNNLKVLDIAGKLDEAENEAGTSGSATETVIATQKSNKRQNFKNNPNPAHQKKKKKFRK